ncbi:unnamed protein product [Schistosoma curassoni]|uniref:Transposase n=1 Tax=Schistosoma curassoni TaxID=6186 RepID=A0A183L3J7_9TREM|nr:unnamed protein product [Schistosoma curassoni]
MALLGRIEGVLEPSELVDQLNSILNEHQTAIITARLDRYWYHDAPNTYEPQKSHLVCAMAVILPGCSKPKQMVFLGGQTWSLRPTVLIHKTIEQRREMQSHGS